MKTFLRSLLVIFLLSVSVLIGKVSAQSRLTYPIPDLGYCRDAKECYLYCEIPENKATCWSYGKYQLGSQVLGVSTMSDEEKQYMREKAKQYGITFPIADLGNCAGPQECRDFCEQPANQATCMDFAKKKGFDKEMQESDGMDPGKRDELLQQAKTELGCTSMESCSRVCESDHSRCEAFARKHGVHQEPPQSQGRYSAEEKRELMQKAQSELGCTSMESCRSVCETNPGRCMAFAKKHGFDKGHEEDRQQYQSGASPRYGTQRFGSERLPAGRQGCDSEESCKKYCQEHPDECPGFKGYTRATQEGSGSYVSPSGCRNEAECKSWCESNPDKCPGFSEARAKEEETKHVEEQYKLQQNYQEQQSQQYQNYQYVSPPSPGPSFAAPSPNPSP